MFLYHLTSRPSYYIWNANANTALSAVRTAAAGVQLKNTVVSYLLSKFGSGVGSARLSDNKALSSCLRQGYKDHPPQFLSSGG